MGSSEVCKRFYEIKKRAVADAKTAKRMATTQPSDYRYWVAIYDERIKHIEALVYLWKGNRRKKTYAGKRTPDGSWVMVDGRPLPPRNDLRNHSPSGFSWGYGGSGPAQLALAILANHFGPYDREKKALDIYQDFKFAFVAGWSGDTWTITTAEIDDWLATKGEKRG
jgi:hypothetical protein